MCLLFKLHSIMSNICDRTDTSTCTYYFTVKYIRLCIVCVVVLIDACRLYSSFRSFILFHILNLHL